jgi:hypothetical protein
MQKQLFKTISSSMLELKNVKKYIHFNRKYYFSDDVECPAIL